MNLLIFTDLDGTLLDEEDYSHRGAAEALARIRRLRIPLIFTTSKTRAEIEVLQRRLSLQEPFIAENGAAVYFPQGYRGFTIEDGLCRPPYSVLQLGRPYGEVRRFFAKARERFELKGFGDLSLEEIAALSGLSPAQAALARQRESTEPFLASAPEKLERLARLAARHGLKITSGGRFLHLMGNRQDKGRAVRRCLSVSTRNQASGLLSIGLGDSANDIPLLKSVDWPILLPRAGGVFLGFDRPGLLRADRPGSAGWNEVVLNAPRRLAL